MSGIEKYRWVDAIRGYAILLVMLIHSSHHFFSSVYAKIITNSGDMGVQLFFVMSSFTLFNSFSKRMNDDRVQVNRNFFIRRFFRIAPYYYVAGLIYILYDFLVLHKKINFIYVISNYTFTNGIYLPAINTIPPGGWSVGIEMLFYLTIPLLFKYITSLKKAIYFLLLSILFSYVLHFLLELYITGYTNRNWTVMSGWSFYFWLPNQFPIFIYGIILYFIYKEVKISARAGKIILGASFVLFLSLSFFIFLFGYPQYFIKREYVFGFIFLCFATGLYATQHKFLINQYATKIGLVSFSMYLNHFIVLYFLDFVYHKLISYFKVKFHIAEIYVNNDLVFILCYLITVTITFYFSRLTYKYIEAKGIDMGNILINRLNKTALQSSIIK
jgi:peptidoglycan/LPS O-acetylase OafA/YrhL